MAVRVKQTEEERKAEMETRIAVLKGQQERFLEMLLAGNSISEACRILQIGRRTATYWMRLDANVRLVYERERLRLAQEFRERLCKLQDMALSALEESLTQTEDPALRYTAAKFIYSAHLADYKLDTLDSASSMIDAVIRSIPDANMKQLHGKGVDWADIPDDY
jgi:hypothetical protein